MLSREARVRQILGRRRGAHGDGKLRTIFLDELAQRFANLLGERRRQARAAHDLARFLGAAARSSTWVTSSPENASSSAGQAPAESSTWR